MSARTRSMLLLHGVVVIFGFTGILGKLISIDAEPLVFWRVTLGGLTTAAFLWFRSRWSSWTWPNVLRVGLVGWVVAAHWVTFFASIKASSVGLALTMLATAPLFVGLIEPVVFKRSIAWREMAVAAVVFVGIALVFQAERDQTAGILLGLASAVLAAMFSTVNGVLVKQHDPVQLSAVELLAASVGMALWLAMQGAFDLSLIQLSGSDWLWIVLLAVVATSFAFMVSIQVLQQLTPFESAMAINLEPIYAIVLAYVLFDERFSSGFYLGAALVIGAVLVDTLLRATPREKAPPPHGRR